MRIYSWIFSCDIMLKRHFNVLMRRVLIKSARENGGVWRKKMKDFSCKTKTGISDRSTVFHAKPHILAPVLL